MATRRSSKPRETRQSLPLPIGGGLFTAGDYARTPPGTSPKMKNCFVRPGPRVEMRPGWLRESALPTLASTSRLFRTDGVTSFTGSPSTTLLLAGSNGFIDYGASYSSGAWTARTVISFLTRDGCTFNDTFYGTVANYVSGSASTVVPHLWSYAGAGTLNADAGATGLAGASICPFNHRLFLASIVEMPINQAEITNAHLKFEDAAVWTLGGGPPTVASAGGIRTVTIVGATDTLKTTAAIYTSGAATEYVMPQPIFRAVSATVDLPFTVTIEDAAGANVYGSMEVLVANRTIQPDWQRFAFPSAVRIPATTAVYMKIKPGTSTITAAAGSVDVSDSAGGRYWFLTKGRRVWGTTGLTVGVTIVAPRNDRLVWCEVDDPTYWRAGAYYDCRESPGPLTVVRQGRGRLFAFKKDAIWIFGSQDNANLPIQFVDLLRDVGCVGVQAIAQHEDVLYFASEREVYAWDMAGKPTAIAGDAMRETLFNDNTVAAPILQVDAINKQLWCYLQPGKVYTYNIETQTWSGPITFTGADDSELTISDLLFIKPNGETRAEMWACMSSSANVVKLRASQTQDNITGTARDVVAEYWFRPIQTLDPKQSVILESIEIDHKVTADQTGSTTTAEISFDGGTTFSKAVDVTLAPLASGNYRPMRLDLWQSDERLLVAVKHTGLAGPQYFNISGGSAMVQVCGDAIRSNPTTTGSTL